MSQIYDALKRAEDEHVAALDKVIAGQQGNTPPSAFIGTPSWAKDIVAQLNELGVAIGRVEVSVRNVTVALLAHDTGSAIKRMEAKLDAALDVPKAVASHVALAHLAAIDKKLDTIQARALLGEFERGAATATGKRRQQSRAGRGKR
jgi:hypothetical protein